MTLPQFRCLSLPAQLTWVEGTYLGRRWEQEADVNLYYLLSGGRGFFVEVGLSAAQDCFVVLRSFSHSAPLEAYTVSVAALY
jgi:hypothetical protein